MRHLLFTSPLRNGWIRDPTKMMSKFYIIPVHVTLSQNRRDGTMAP